MPTIFSYGVEGQAFAQWIDRQVVEVKALLKRQPSLGVVCLGNQAQSQFFFSQLQASGLAVQSGTLVQDSELKYSLHLAN
ncbi:putative membrane efflux protein [Chlamydia trachomatis]|nr:putative membrane efflux protein [Chlamydia trachomatis]